MQRGEGHEAGEAGCRGTTTYQRLGCIECGATCCAACAIHLESAVYCGTCAESLLETTAIRAGGPFALH
jgi:hypothetical protein